MDLQHKGYITKDEYVKMIVKSVGEERAMAIFDAMDTDRKGKVISIHAQGYRQK